MNSCSPASRKLRIHASSEEFPGSDYSDEERRFLIAMDRYRRERHRLYPTWREVLHVVHELGYRRIETAGAIGA